MSGERSNRPTSGRVARTARLGRVAAGGAARWAGDRLDARGSDEQRRRRRGDRVVATIDSLVDQLSVMRGAAMKAGQVLSTIEFPGLDADQSEHLQQPARLAARRRPGGELEGHAGGARRRVGQRPRAPAREHRTRAGRRGQHRPGLPGGRPRRPRLAIKVQYPGIGEAVESDMRNLRLLTPVLRRLMPGLEVKDVLAELPSGSPRSATTSSRPPTTAVSPASGAITRSSRSPRSTPQLSRRRVLVTEWVDGIGFEEVAEEPDESATATRRSSTASSTPPPRARLRARRSAPGQLPAVRRRPRRLLRLRDGPRASRRLPAPARRAIFAAIREGDEHGPGARAARPRLPAGTTVDWNGELLLEHMRAASWWLRTDGRSASPPRTSGAAPSRCASSGRRPHAADAPDDPPARGAAAAADGGPSVPDRDDPARRGALGRR